MTQTADCISQKAQTRRVRISVIVPVYNRSKELSRCLAAILREVHGRDDVEVLICDDGSTDDLSVTMAPLTTTHGQMISHLRQPHQGAASARNLGIMHAQGEILAFTDSDCEPDANWLAELVRPFEDPSVGLVGGLIDHHRAMPISARCMNFLMSSTLGAGGARDPRALIHMRYYPRAGNLAVRRDLAQAAGGFPACSHGEDLEFSRKVLALGTRVRFAPAARVMHHENRSVLQAFREAAKKGAARVRLARRQGMHELMHALPALLCVYVTACGLAWIVQPGLLRVLWLPGCLYVLALVILAIQGAVSLRSPAAALFVPIYAIAMHAGYGLGYLVECSRALYAALSLRPHRGDAADLPDTPGKAAKQR